MKNFGLCGGGPDTGNSTNIFKKIVNNHPHAFDIENINQDEALKYIKQLPSYKSSGLPEIGTRLINLSMIVLINQFTQLFNKIINTGIYPRQWKKAIVIHIPKKKNAKYTNEISLIPSPSKVMEKIIHEQMKPFLEMTNFFSDDQHGFRVNRSTIKATSLLVDYRAKAMNKSEVVVVIYIDFRKAI